jgi:hypothetical protein
MDFVTDTGRYNEISFYGCIEMSLKSGAKNALNAIAKETYDHDLPNFCYGEGTNHGSWGWCVKSYINMIVICKCDSKEQVEEIREAINTGYNKWKRDEEKSYKNRVENMIERSWL